MEFAPRQRGQYFISSKQGYKISFSRLGEEHFFSAWPPKMEGNLYKPPLNHGRFPLSIIDSSDLDEVKQACAEHYAASGSN